MPFSPYRVLLVDDNEDDYVIIRDLLDDIAFADKARSADHVEVEWVSSFEAAHAALTQAETPYDVCLLDYTLGSHTGLDLLQLLPANNPTPVIMLTGSDDHDVDVRAALAGAADYLLKGNINAPLLERSMRYAMERARRETERAKREANLQEVLHQSQLLATAVSNLTDGMLVTDARQDDNPIIFCNPAFYAMTGYSPDEVVGRNCRFLQGPDSDPQKVREMREAIQEQRAFSGVIRNYRKDGTAFWNGLKITPVFDAQGQVTNFVGLQSDVTAQREAELAQREAERAL